MGGRSPKGAGDDVPLVRLSLHAHLSSVNERVPVPWADSGPLRPAQESTRTPSRWGATKGFLNKTDDTATVHTAITLLAQRLSLSVYVVLVLGLAEP